MDLCCLLFSSDEGSAQPICQVLADLGIEVESCSEAVAAVEKVTNQTFQIVVIDWDKQPEAGFLLTTTRERKPTERPLTLAIVSDDGSIPKALQAGANSILRKPVLVNQARDTLKTARDLLRLRQGSTPAAHATAAEAGIGGTASTLQASVEEGAERTLRAGEFLQAAPTAPGGQFVTDADVHESQYGQTEPVDPLKDLEPTAAAVAKQRLTPAPPADEPRGLEWYLKARAGAVSSSGAAAAPAPVKPELLGFDQMESKSTPYSSTPVEESAEMAASPIPRVSSDQDEGHEQKKEAELFAYIAGEREELRHERGTGFRLGKKAIIGAGLLASLAIVAAPQAPWHSAMQATWTRGQLALHAWLNPQPVTPAQAPESHENFGRAGDEYKLPVAENIPDATTDPSQIQVVPVIDPTAKKPNSLGGNAMQGDATSINQGEQTPNAGVQVQENPVPGNAIPVNPVSGNPVSGNPVSPVSGNPGQAQGNPSGTPSAGSVQPAGALVAGGVGPAAGAAGSATTAQPSSNAPAVVLPSATTVSEQTAAKDAAPRYVADSSNVPSSLKSQLAPAAPDPGANKGVETAMAAIEPVNVAEAAERALLTDQPAVAYPAAAKGQQGTVVLQVLVGRDGTVQDAKFLQGSLAFARAAIDGVKQWKFKPYIMNGRPVSVQTVLTMGFKPAT